MNKIILIVLLFFEYKSITFDEALKNLETLELRITDYKNSNDITDTLEHLIVSYVREGRYSSTEWTTVCGSVSQNLKNYITDKDTSENTNVANIRNYAEITLPTNETVDFVHLFAVMNGIEYNDFTSDQADLCGWAGDTAQLFQDIKGYSGGIQNLLKEAKNLLGVSGSFGEADLISDLDGPIILNLRNKNKNKSFAKIINDYYNGNEYKNRTYNFILMVIPELLGRTNKNYREILFDDYSSNSYIKTLECKYELRNEMFTCLVPGSIKSQYENHEKAAVYAFADYLYDNNKYNGKEEDVSNYIGINILFVCVLFCILI